ncbi:MAG TPA: Gfo/Idh/MocA family oxidoreductase [Methylomirabilota bacterium]|nr:Gfo/Idh/MocA family oxidoreductase [Methylomirabilota bacterium]
MAPPLAELRLGLVGFGKLVREYYLPALGRLAGTRVVAVADPLAESRRAAERRLHDAAIFTEHRAMLERGAIDALLVASPPATHLDVWSDALARGLPAFVEKPLLLSGQLPHLAVVEAPRVMVDFNRRFWPTYRQVRDLVQRGVLGSPVDLDFVLQLDVDRWCSVTRHRLDAQQGGLLHDLGCHAIDLALDVIGEEPKRVVALTSSQRWPDDQVRLRLDFPSGSSATCQLGYGDRTRERLVVRGPAKTARLAEPNTVLQVDAAGARRNPLVAWALDAASLGYRGLRRSQSMGQASIREALAAFVHSLRTGSPFAPGFADGLRNARWVGAAMRSAAGGGRAQTP